MAEARRKPSLNPDPCATVGVGRGFFDRRADGPRDRVQRKPVEIHGTAATTIRPDDAGRCM
jgi:hypothetical protein